ncbi:maleylpyruvate isomerase N-terminal domain-containing protein [Nocardioides sp.]|uniref:maleylpyruvate isomerase N-terminal domain-containing protein n=1 Tax=Nocardioides sp. TaxID=35761 RepID=UPI003D1297C3
MNVAQHLEGLRVALVAFVRYADRAGLDAPVPTTPAWCVRDLIAHQGMVHRWAAAVIRGERIDPGAVEGEGRAAADPVEWLRDGAIAVVQAISDAPEDLDVLVFLRDAPGAREFWARRQCHETTMHAVDALAASLGRYPRAADTAISTDVALDGIDELLTGFITRDRSRLRSEEPMTIAVRPTDAGQSWLVRVSTDPAVTTRHPASVVEQGSVVEQSSVVELVETTPDIVLEGTAVQLYLSLWNRSDEVIPEGDWDLWVEGAQIRWS